MSLFPLSRRRRAPSFAAHDTPAARDRSRDSACTALAVLALFGPEPADRALAGWCPGDSAAYAVTELRQWVAAEEIAPREEGAA
jgi:hypothetical protein